MQTNEFSGNSAAICPLACGEALCFWLLMCSLWQLRKGQGFLELPPLPTPLLIYDMDFEIGSWTKGSGWRMGWNEGAATWVHLVFPTGIWEHHSLTEKHKPQKKPQTKTPALVDGETNPIWKIYKLWCFIETWLYWLTLLMLTAIVKWIWRD